MYEYLKGKIAEISPAHTVLDVNQVGYFINISLHTFSQIQKRSETLLYVHEVIREDAHLLFGFCEKNERELFRQLISVSGIGSNTARMMLSSLSPIELQSAIVTGQVDLLKSIKGIGLKTAQRVVVELKDKLGKSSVDDNFLTLSNNTVREEALSALVMLGFQKINSQKIVDKLLAEQPKSAVESVIKMALKML